MSGTFDPAAIAALTCGHRPTESELKRTYEMAMRGPEGWCYGHQIQHVWAGHHRPPCVCGEHT